MPTEIRVLGACGRREWVASIFAAVSLRGTLIVLHRIARHEAKTDTFRFSPANGRVAVACASPR